MPSICLQFWPAPYKAQKKLWWIYHPPVIAHPILQKWKSLLIAALKIMSPPSKLQFCLQFFLRPQQEPLFVGFLGRFYLAATRLYIMRSTICWSSCGRNNKPLSRLIFKTPRRLRRNFICVCCCRCCCCFCVCFLLCNPCYAMLRKLRLRCLLRLVCSAKLRTIIIVVRASSSY